MAANSLPADINFNDKGNLDLYFKIRQFNDDPSLSSLVLPKYPKENRLKIHIIADSFNLEYEYSIKTEEVVLSRIPEPIQAEATHEEPTNTIPDQELNHWDLRNHDFGQGLDDFLDFDKVMGCGGVDAAATGAESTTISHNTLKDLALSIFELSQSRNAFTARQTSSLAPDTMLQETDELLSAAHHETRDSYEPTADAPEVLILGNDELQEQLGHSADPQVLPYQCEDVACKGLSFESMASLRCHCFEAHPVSTANYYGGIGSLNSKHNLRRAYTDSSYPSRVLSSKAVMPWDSVIPPPDRDPSESAHSDTSFRSTASGRSGRIGPLSDWARAGMKAMKLVGACWRCMVLRKKCDPATPCLICPKGEKSGWEALGCHRGDFKTRMLPIRVCPAEFAQNTEIEAYSSDDSPFQRENPVRKSWIEIDPADSGVELDENSLRKQEIRKLFLKAIEDKCKLLSNPPDPAVLQPLQYCTMCIVWEILQIHDSLTLSDGGGILNTLLKILPAAVVYQAHLESDQLIAQSLICLRSCFQVLGSDTDVLDRDSHRLCHKFQCGYSSIKELRVSIMLYLDELSRVFFKGDTIRDKGRWSWLSVFYSFCIQSLVRTSLIEIVGRYAMTEVEGTDTAVKQYLFLPLRLFIASNHKSSIKDLKDPLVTDETLGTQQPSLKDYESARIAVNHADWTLIGINNWGEYLKRLFQDDGGVLAFNKTTAQSEARTATEDGDDIAHTSRRRKMNPCQQCCSARTRCLPYDRQWPQKCEQCLQRGLECSEPARKRRSFVPRTRSSS